MRFYDIGGANATQPAAAVREHARHARVLHLGGPEEPESRADVRVQRDPELPDLRHLAGAATSRRRSGSSTAPTASATPAAPASTPSSVSNDGKRLYLALLTRGFGVGDVSDFTDNDPATNTYRLVTPQANRVQWAGPGAHSAVKLWNKDWAYVSDEVYGTITAAGHGCPWGWARFVDIADPTRPVVRSEFRLPENQPLTCERVQSAAHVLLGAQPDADAEHRVQHVALGRLPGDRHHQPGGADAPRRVLPDAAGDRSARGSAALVGLRPDADRCRPTRRS